MKRSKSFSRSWKLRSYQNRSIYISVSNARIFEHKCPPISEMLDIEKIFKINPSPFIKYIYPNT